MVEPPVGGLCADLAEATSIRAALSVFCPRDETVHANVAKAKEICWRCPVQLGCLEWAMQCNDGKPEEYGVLGGTTGAERKLFAKALKKGSKK
jgi:hypothetical protein